MKIANDIAEVFGKDVEHLHGNLYRVRRSRIRIARAGVSVDGGCLVYGNPRWFTNKRGELEARGVESSKMDELKASIQNSGLDNPIRVRPMMMGGDFLEIINGERRFRCIESLCENGAKCHDSSTGKKSPAGEVYEWVDCRVEQMDDREALSVALKTNETSEVIGDLASIEVVKALRASGYDDQEILKATGKSVSWLRETDRIIGLDETCLDHFQSDQITRKAALQLALIENAEERIELLEQIVGIARGRHDSKLRQLDRQIEEAEENEIINTAAAEVAKKIGDEGQARKLAAESAKAKSRVEKARGEREKATSKGPKADARDIKKAKGRPPKGVKQAGADHGATISSYMKMIESILASEGFDTAGDSLGVDLEILTAILGVLGAIMDGDAEPMDVLQANCPIMVEEDEDAAADDDEGHEEYEEESEVSDDLNSDFEEEEEDIPPELASEWENSSNYDEDDEG